MQRVPKYRAWDISEQCWINISKMVFGENGELWYLQGYDENENEIDLPYFENETNWILMQCIGVKDTDENEIFESDFVEDEHGRINLVKFKEGLFLIGNWNSHGFMNAFTEFKVIGNIYENPELLEVKS